MMEKSDASDPKLMPKPPLPTPKWKPNNCRKRKRSTQTKSIPMKDENVASPAIGRKKVSWVWDHFTKYEGNGEWKASCNYCGQEYAAHSKLHGTGEKDNDEDEGIEIVEKEKGSEGNVKGRDKDSKLFGPPDEEDWDVARSFTKFLKLFYDVTLQFSGSSKVTSNLFFLELVAVQTTLKKLSKNKDPKVCLMAMKMQQKFAKYWESVDKINFLLYVATVLDPPYKLRFVRFCFDQVYENDFTLADFMEEQVRNALTRLYDCYKQCDLSENPKPMPSSSNQTSADLDIDENVDTVKILATQFEKHLEENDYIETKSELTRYLGENCEKNVESFNVLKWWKDNSMKYRVLSQIARDVLAIPVSTVASESAFSTSGRILDPYRSSLNPEMVEALVCCQNWLRSEPFTIDIQEFMKEVPIEEVEKYEEVIKEFKTCGTSVEVQVIDN
ncbi:hypothetical protein BUALT_Bualt13G0046600 [Buddleja alternifolia]|uniref:Zinc finger BED domain-containing protein RICESLEEPER 2-like n=1 Tax=Buddleja alternifolia TaxID=168488 RepID=A0AAV6WVJ4_9LAMI|nr:hypothetical protein BUALT_Bualt13G0046600 [Buddleja alternifolia]